MNHNKSKNTLSKRIVAIEDSQVRKTLSLIEELSPYWDNPNKLYSVSLSTLRDLSEKRAIVAFQLDYLQLVAQQSINDGKASEHLFSTDYYNRATIWLHKLEIAIETQVEKLLKIKIWVFTFIALTTHIFILGWLTKADQTFLLSLYLTIGSLSSYFFARAIAQFIFKLGKNYLSILPQPLGLISIPITSLLIIGVIFLSPSFLPIQNRLLGKIAQSVYLNIDCNSGISTGAILPVGEKIIIQNKVGECLLVKTEDGSVGYINQTAIKVLPGNSIDNLRKETLLLFLGFILFVFISWLVRWTYLNKFVPWILEKKVLRNESFLYKQMNHAQLVQNILVEGSLLSDIDIQEAKSNLMVKVAERYREQASRIIDSPELNRNEKNKMIKELTKLTAAALRGSN